ncbi:MAG TPA: SAM-dependent methyltransferase [Methylomirabilota bacterium]|nr:SAM-dependent methyltransferase [Methylomirabilota bacterium]
MPSLNEIIRQEIHREGAIPFHRFMELALYCPELGYYERCRIGREGDFYTSVSTGTLFGALLAHQFTRWLEAHPSGVVTIVEAGSHDGILARDILKWLSLNRPDLFARLKYSILEPSSRRRAWQEQTLNEFAGQVGWFADWEALRSRRIVGVIFSNELLDAFPLRRFGWDAAARRWFEWGVRADENGLAWTRMPLTAAEWQATLTDTGIDLPPELCGILPDGYTVEVAPGAGQWWRQAAEALESGHLVTFDYGFTGGDFIRPERLHGTLRAYHHHSLVANPLAEPGEADLTAHVNFTQLQRAGEAAGLRTERLESQAAFLTRIVRDTMIATSTTWTPSERRQFQALTHPDHLGRAFQVLVQSRAVPTPVIAPEARAGARPPPSSAPPR